MTGVTEAEAKAKWCPFARPSSEPTAFRVQGSGQQNCCVGATCMMWRWTGPPPTADSVDRALTIMGTAQQRSAAIARVDAQRKGFCGLAGGGRADG